MNDHDPKLAPFPPSYRGSGLLLHVTSLPSPYGIGDLGPGAIAGIDAVGNSEVIDAIVASGCTGGGSDRGRLTLSALNHHSSTNNLIHEYRKFKEAL
jgi:hypothetical protein